MANPTIKSGDKETPKDSTAVDDEVKVDMPLNDVPLADEPVAAQQAPQGTYAAPPTQPQPTPVQGFPVQVGEEVVPVYSLGPDEQKLLTTYSLARGIKILSIMDAVILLINIISFGMLRPWGPLMVCFFWGPLAGFFSAQWYNPALGTLYLVYYLARIAVDIVAVSYRLWWFVISIFIDLFIARFVWSYVLLLRFCTPDELEFLRHPEQARHAIAPRAQPYFVVF